MFLRPLILGIVLLPAFTSLAGEKSKAAPDEGFVPLIVGDSLQGWQGALDGYELKKGVLASKEESGGFLHTAKEYADFVFRFEFKLSPGGNNGIALRAPLDGRTSRTGMEIQVLDDTAEKYKTLNPWQFHGSVYGLVPAKRGHLKPVGQWNDEEILCQGRRVRVTLNGTVIVDANLAELDHLGDKGLDGYDHPGRYRKSGHLGFMGHRSRVEFRNLRVKELPSDTEVQASGSK
ncbi:MAG: 3-keto-disaccharide hydrolase [Thermoguttaceae bacterium]